MEKDFKSSMMDVISWFLNPSNLKTKNIAGNDISVGELKEYIEAYFEIFQSEDSPQGQSVYQITVEKQMNILIESSLTTYKQQMARNNDYSSTIFVENFGVSHEFCKKFSLLEFKTTKKIGSKFDVKKYSAVLEQNISDEFESLKQDAMQNHKKLLEEQEKKLEALKKKTESNKKLW